MSEVHLGNFYIYLSNMSISRKNWSALSSLARQWTMEDEEEVEREKRRKERSSSSTADADVDFSQTPRDTTTSDSAFGTGSTSETSPGLNSVEQMQLDFVEMLRARDEKRRMRQVETLRRQKELGEDEAMSGGGGARVELLGDLDEDQGSVLPSGNSASKPQPPPKTASYSHTNSSNTSTNNTSRQHENGESSCKDLDPKPSSNPTRKFVSSVSISLDRSPSTCTTPMSPCSPVSPQEHWPSPCESPSLEGAQSPAQNGHAREMMRKKEEDSAPLHRSASMRIASKKFETNTDQVQNEDEDKASSFQRNSRQRISSRSIKEKMERLAQAAQKSEMVRSPDVTQRTLFLLDEVSRKRGLFEKEQPAACPTSPGVSRQEFRSFTSGMSDRINQWLNKTNQTGPSHSPVDLRHVDITSKRSLFESSGGDSKTSSGK
uniref:ladinin-1 isoform X2 n=1 Tax=Scatophagus argus TaxID=75038 RepID=UPI001ED84790|nr:ladinin-1 isoform X2 [Scatophagus argus]